MAQQKQRWEPPPFLLKKSQQQLDFEREEAEKNKPVDMTPGKWQPPPDLGIMIGGKPIEQPERPQGDIEAEVAQNKAEANSTSLIERIYNAGSKGALDYLPESKQKYRPSELYKRATEGLREFGESGGKEDTFTNRVKKVARYGQAFGETFSGGLENALNPIQIGLMAISGGSSAAFSGANKLAKESLFKTANWAKGTEAQHKAAVNLYRLGKALEFPGKLASGAQVAHGGHKFATGDTWEEKAGGMIDMALGGAGLRYRGTRTYPDDSIKSTATRGGFQTKTKVNTKEQHGPNEQLFFPLRGRENPIRSSTFKSGPKGTYREGDIVLGELGDVPASTAYNYGTVKANKSGKPFVETGTGDELPVKPAVDSNKIEALRHYMQGTQDGTIPKGVTFPDYFAGIQSVKPNIPVPVEEPIITTPDKPVSFDEILPPTELQTQQEGPRISRLVDEGGTLQLGFHGPEGEETIKGMFPDQRVSIEKIKGSSLGDSVRSQPYFYKVTFWNKNGAIDYNASKAAKENLGGHLYENKYALEQPTESNGLIPDVKQPLKQGAVFAFDWPKETAQDGSTFGGFPMYNVPTENGMTTVGADEVVKMGYELPPVTEAMQRPESLPTIEPELNELPAITQTKQKPQVRSVVDVKGNTRVWIDDIEFTDRFGPGGPTQFDVRRLQSQIDDPASFKRLAELKGEQYVGMANPLPVNQPNQLVPDIRQLPSPINSIGNEIVNPSVDLSTGINLNEPIPEVNESTTPVRASDQWQEMLDELDEQRAPDSAYRDILSTGSKDPLKKRETWRDRVQKYIRMDREKNPDPNYEPDSGPEMARSEKDGKSGIKISVNVRSAAKEVTTGYSTPMPGVMIREGMQNGLDAVKALGLDGKLDVFIDNKGSMTITDNGPGMNRQQLETVFSTLNESGKATEEGATGGKGVGKASYMLGGEHFEVRTVSMGSDGIKRQLRAAGTPEEFMEHVDIEETIVDESTPVGTIINTEFTKKNGSTGSSDAKDMLRNVTRFSRGLGTEITWYRYGEINEPVKQVINDGLTDTIIGEAQFTNGGTNDVTLRIPENTKMGDKQYLELRVLNNGMYQYSKIHYLSAITPFMPDDLIVNIKPHAEEGTPEYPFPTSRESVKDTLDNDIKKFVDQVLVEPQTKKRKNILKELYEGMEPLKGITSGNTREITMFDAGGRFTLEDREFIRNSTVIRKLGSFTDDIIGDVLNSLGQNELSDRLEKVGLLFFDGAYGIHIPNPIQDNSTILINYMLHGNKPNPRDAARGAVQTILHEVAHIGKDAPVVESIINPASIDDKRLGEYLQGYFKHKHEHGGLNAGHALPWVKRLGETYAKYTPKQAFRAIDKLTSIISDKSGGYNPEFQELLQIYSDSRGRDAITEDVLSRTGDQSKSSTGGKGNVPGDSEGDGDGIAPRPRKNRKEPVVEGQPTQVIEASVGRLKEALVAGKLARNKQDLLVSAARSKRAGRIANVKTRGLAGYQQQLGMLSGPLPKVNADSIITDQDIDVLIDAVTDFQELRPYEEISAKRGLVKLLAGEAPQNSEMALISRVFDDPDLGGLVELHAGLGGFEPNRRLVNNILHLAKTMKASMDLSGSLRQGLPFIDRKEYWKAFWNMHKYLGFEVAYQGGLEAMRSHPDFDLIMETPLFLAGFKGQGRGQSGNALENREEQFISEWGDRIPLVKHSQRAYIGFLDELRFNTMVSFMADARKLGIELSEEQIKYEGTKREMTQTISTPALDEMAKMINIFTGRGDLGRLEKMAVELNWGLWSPKFLKSRMTILNPFYYKNASPFVQKQALRSLLVIAGAGAGILALAAAGGATVNYDDPTSADFMKARFGKTRLDPWAGLQQNVVAEARILTYLRNAVLFLRNKPIPKDQKYRPGSGYNTRTARDVGIDFAENKISPLANFVSSLSDLGKSYEPAGSSKLLTDDWNLLPNNRVTKEVINLYSPMMMDTIIDLVKDDPTLFPLGMDTLIGKTIPLALASTYGNSIQTYDQNNATRSYRPRVPRLMP